MLLRLLLAILVVFPTLVIFHSEADACECIARRWTATDDLEFSELVFRGVVTSLERSSKGGGYEVGFSVVTIWKGTVGSEITVFTPDSDECGYWFKEGVEYLVYVWDSTALVTDLGYVNTCSRTAPIHQAGEDLAAFHSGAQTAPDAGFPNTGNGGLANHDAGQDQLGAIAVIAAAATLMLGFAGVRQHVRRQARPDEPTNVDRT